MITKEQVLAAKEKFAKEYWKYPPINGVGITRDENQEYSVCCTLESGDKPEGYPDEIDGIRVVYKTIGSLTFHG